MDFRASLSTFDLGGLSTNVKNTPFYWRGGVDGAENDWNNPSNWYNYFVPSWFDRVIIPSCEHNDCNFPIIESFVSDISSLTIEEGGKLMIGRKGKLTIDGLEKRTTGIINQGDLVNFGELTILRTRGYCLDNGGYLINKGSIAIDKKTIYGIREEFESTFLNQGEFLILV